MTSIATLSALLPTKLSRTIAGLTWPASIAVATLPHWLSPYMPSLTEATIVLSQVALFLASALSGVMLVLASLLLHYSSKPAKWPLERYMNLPMNNRMLLAIASISTPTIKAISQETIMSEDSVRYWLAVHRNAGNIELDDPIRFTETGHRNAINV